MPIFKKILGVLVTIIIFLVPVAWTIDGCNIAESNLRPLDQNYIKFEQQLKELNKSTYYVTAYGKRYHEQYHYANRNYPMPLGDCILAGYTPCCVCSPPYVDFGPYDEPFWLTLLISGTWLSGLFVFALPAMVFSLGFKKTFSMLKNGGQSFVKFLCHPFKKAAA